MTLDLTTLDMAFDAIIFDCDGTLVDKIPVYARAWSQGFASSGVQMNRDWYLERAGMSEHVLLRDFEREHGVAVNDKEVVGVMRASFLDNLNAVREIQA